MSRDKVTEWHDWFAWHCVRVEGKVVVLEYVQRKGTYQDGEWTWEYRMPPSD